MKRQPQRDKCRGVHWQTSKRRIASEPGHIVGREFIQRGIGELQGDFIVFCHLMYGIVTVVTATQ
jgi:hypothetical protein